MENSSARQPYFAGIGGEKNIQRLENCMTRVRVEVHDDDQLDIAHLKQLRRQRIRKAGAAASADRRAGKSGAGR